MELHGSARLTREEVKAMFSEMLGVSSDEIDDDDPEVLACTGLTKNEMVSKWHEEEEKHAAHHAHALNMGSGPDVNSAHDMVIVGALNLERGDPVDTAVGGPPPFLLSTAVDEEDRAFLLAH